MSSVIVAEFTRCPWWPPYSSCWICVEKLETTSARYNTV